MKIRPGRLAICTLVLVLLSVAGGRAAENPTARLADRLKPFLDCLAGRYKAFTLSADITAPIDGKQHEVAVRLARFDRASFDLEIKHAQYWVRIQRRADRTALVLPYHKSAVIGLGEVDAGDNLAPEGCLARLISRDSLASAYAPLATSGDAQTTALLLTSLLEVSYDADAEQWKAGKDVTFRFGADGKSIDVSSGEIEVQLTIDTAAPEASGVGPWLDYRVDEIERKELEQTLARGARRALEILAPAPALTSPTQSPRKVPHGELRWIDGQRVAILFGTPEEIGRAHGELLKPEAERCCDSVLCTFGVVNTIRSGRWFRHDLEAAYARLKPHIPERHLREMQALADSLGVDPKVIEAASIFPELFHCSGFAVFGKATKDGKLYHGRVLDYMTTIGLQDAAVTFIVKPDGKNAFANVGYAGFIGSVSGMNDKGISLGEMGGRGEGQWDGVPMATLMRRALEECTTLDEVMELWKSNPRTCEYYYVFADGKTNRAVGVAATPESVEFVLPGAAHPRLGEGIEDAVLMSAGDRLTKLRQRTRERYGEIDAESAQLLMCRPVAMESNLHNVLFVPADGVLYVANASHSKPAAELPYVRIDLREMLRMAPR